MTKPTARESLLNAACKLFSEKGYKDVATREIAELADVNLGAINYYFGSKAQLFVETIRRVTSVSDRVTAHECLLAPLETPVEAGSAFYKFLYNFMSHLLRPEGPSACKLMYREIHSDTANDLELFEALVASAVKEYFEPLDKSLQKVLIHLSKDCNQGALERTAQSIFGQCAFYVTHRPFIERLRGVDYSKSPEFEETIKHIFCFSLSGLGCPQDLIEESLKRGREETQFVPRSKVSVGA